MDYRIINYKNKYKKQVEKMIEDFQSYLIKIDTWNVFKLEKDFGKKQLEELLKSVKENKGKGRFLLVEYQNQAIGYVVGYTIQDKENIEIYPWKRGYVDELYLEKEYRGKGIGRRLLGIMEKHFRDKKCDTMGFNALIANTKAIDFYLKNGFEKRSLFLSKALNKKVKK